MSKTPTTNPDTEVPPLVESPVFKERAASALGGVPTNPTAFRPIRNDAAGNASGVAADSLPQRRSNSTFDVDPAAVAHREKINSIRASLSSLITSVDATVEEATAHIAALQKDKTGREEAARQGFDFDVASVFLAALTKAVDVVKPKQG